MPFILSIFISFCNLDYCSIDVNFEIGGRLLCLDGGGVKGIVEAEILMLIQYCVNNHFKGKETSSDDLSELCKKTVQEQYDALLTDEADHPELHKLFDVVAGTSTGSIVATGLSRLHWSAATISSEFRIISPVVFGEKTWWGWLSGIFNTPKYNVKPFEEFLKTSLKDIEWKGQKGGPILVIPALLADENHANGYVPYVFDSVKCAGSSVNVWKAIRASSAAPTYFEPMKISLENETYEFIDGGMQSNCPVIEGMELLKTSYSNECCVISIGCGESSGKAPIKNGIQALFRGLGLTTDAEQRWRTYVKSVGSKEYYFRINPDSTCGLGNYDLANYQMVGEMAVRFTGWIRGRREQREYILKASKLIFAKSICIENVHINNCCMTGSENLKYCSRNIQAVQIGVAFTAHSKCRVKQKNESWIMVNSEDCSEEENVIYVEVSTEHIIDQELQVGIEGLIHVKYEGVDINGSPLKLMFR